MRRIFYSIRIFCASLRSNDLVARRATFAILFKTEMFSSTREESGA
jgi:hypothetical protein